MPAVASRRSLWSLQGPMQGDSRRSGYDDSADAITDSLHPHPQSQALSTPMSGMFCARGKRLREESHAPWDAHLRNLLIPGH
jgi:hypothetical protein